MARVTVHSAETPTQTIVKAANATVTVKDAKGRSITIKKAGALDKMRLFEVVGSENVTNPAYFGYAMLAYQVVEIDSEPVARPSNKISLEALVQRLEDDGLKVVAEAVEANFMEAEATKEAIKNG
jgi:hypothetical protein